MQSVVLDEAPPYRELIMIDLFEGEFATENTLRFVEEKGCIGLWAWNLRTGEMTWSRGLYALADLEVGRTKPSYEAFYSLIHPEDRLSRGEVERLIRAELPILRNFRLISRVGRVRWISSHSEVLLDSTGQRVRVIGALFDVTRQHDAILAMEAAEARYRALAGATGVSVWVSRADGSEALPAWLRRAAAGTDLPALESWLEAVDPEDRVRAEAGWNAAIAERGTFEIECRLVNAGGASRWFQVRAVPVLTSDGSVREWVWAAIDIEERRANPVLRSAANGQSLTGAQIRAARGLLNWSVRDLSEASGVSPSVIRRLEETNAAPTAREAPAIDLQRAFEANGVEFLFPSLGQPGVRLA